MSTFPSLFLIESLKLYRKRAGKTTNFCPCEVLGTYEGVSTIQTDGSIQKVYNNPDRKTSFGKIKTIL